MRVGKGISHKNIPTIRLNNKREYYERMRANNLVLLQKRAGWQGKKARV